MEENLALVRAVPNSFPKALVRGGRPHIDLDRAKEQHGGYISTLVGAGYAVDVIAADEDHPDCPFIEDVAVVLDHIAVVTRPGAASRRGEPGPVAASLATHRFLRRIRAPGTLDGGDVLTIGARCFVGRSARSNADGIRQFARFAAEDGYATTPVEVSDVLHLKSAVSCLDDQTLLVGPGTVPETMFPGFTIIPKADGEIDLASTLRMRNGRLLMTSNAPETAARVTSSGFNIDLIDMSEFQAVDGGLTCLSILLSG
jgi:dimethylargininase